MPAEADPLELLVDRLSVGADGIAAVSSAML
eukprot:CAMPEP_0182535744 /NCGR_PEP_ID=MMETSP1323-20130603/18655_1 /TAXON_ID=236787 /ORGANISM="Florenciella parvula, Strain RCC1693" /LENGTH=30 /DNA_ID= /DNA_START= /DNA_END= /DNA_ORIENTATION=